MPKAAPHNHHSFYTKFLWVIFLDSRSPVKPPLRGGLEKLEFPIVLGEPQNGTEDRRKQLRLYGIVLFCVIPRLLWLYSFGWTAQVQEAST
jgi:hypothetical protein